MLNNGNSQQADFGMPKPTHFTSLQSRTYWGLLAIGAIRNRRANLLVIVFRDKSETDSHDVGRVVVGIYSFRPYPLGSGENELTF